MSQSKNKRKVPPPLHSVEKRRDDDTLGGVDTVTMGSSLDHNRPCSRAWHLLDGAQTASSPDDLLLFFADWSLLFVSFHCVFASGVWKIQRRGQCAVGYVSDAYSVRLNGLPGDTPRQSRLADYGFHTLDD